MSRMNVCLCFMSNNVKIERVKQEPGADIGLLLLKAPNRSPGLKSQIDRRIAFTINALGRNGVCKNP